MTFLFDDTAFKIRVFHIYAALHICFQTILKKTLRPELSECNINRFAAPSGGGHLVHTAVCDGRIQRTI